MKKIALVAAALIAIPTAAQAQGYAQVQGGLDSVSVLGSSDEGIAFGGAVGYDFALSPNAFIGIEGSVDDSTTKECVADLIVVGDETCAKTGRDLSAVARLGIGIGSSSQVYVLGGYTNARISATYNDGTTVTKAGANGDGFRLGAGYRISFSENMFGKIEYRYSNYESDFSRHNGLVAVGVTF